MLYRPPRSTLHHIVLSGDLVPISNVLIHVSVFLSTALPAPSIVSPPVGVVDWVAVLWEDKSSFQKENIKLAFDVVNTFKKRRKHTYQHLKNTASMSLYGKKS